MRTYQPQVMDLPIDAGLDQATDKVMSKGLAELVNVRYEKEGSLSKRAGTSEVAPGTAACRSEFAGPASSLSKAASQLIQYGIAPTGVHAIMGDHMMRMDPTGTRWDGIGQSTSLVATSTDIGIAASGQVDVAYNTDFSRYCIAYTQSFYDNAAAGANKFAMRIVWEIRDSSDVIIHTGELYGGTFGVTRPFFLSNPNVMYDSVYGVFHIVYGRYDSAASTTITVQINAINQVTGVASTEVTVATFIPPIAVTYSYPTDYNNFGVPIGAAYASGTILVVCGGQGTGKARVHQVTYNGVTYALPFSTDIGTGAGAKAALSVGVSFGQFSGLFRVIVHSFDAGAGTPNYEAWTMTTALGSITSVASRTTLTSSKTCASVLELSASRVFYSVTYALDGISILTSVVADVRTYAGGIIDTWDILNDEKYFQLVSKPFVYKDSLTDGDPEELGVCFLCVSSGINFTYLPGISRDLFVARLERLGNRRNRVCQLAPIAFTGHSVVTGSSHLCAAVVATDGSITTAAVPYLSGNEFNQSISASPAVLYRMKPANESRRIPTSFCAIPGGVPMLFDGSSTVEIAPPCNFKAIFTAGVGGSLTTGAVYGYATTVRVQTASGFSFRHSYSDISNVTMGSNTSVSISGQAQYVIDSLGVPGVDYFVEIWRTAANGSTLYKIRELIMDENSVFKFFYIDTVADASIDINEQLAYPDGVTFFLPMQPPSSMASWIAGQRAWLTETPDGSCWYSSLIIGKEYPVFNIALRIPETPLGKIVAIAQMDNSTVAFAERGVYSVTFDGDFPTLTPISSPTGCSNRNSVVVAGNGVYFAGDDSLYLLARNYTVMRIDGAEDYFSSDMTNILSAEYQDKNNDVYFCIKGTDTDQFHVIVMSELREKMRLVKYTYTREAGEGGQFSGLSYRNGVMSFLTAEGAVLREVPGQWVDNRSDGTSRKWVYASGRTAWAKTESIAGYMRCWRAGVTFDRFGANADFDLAISPYVDFDESAPIQTKTFSSCGLTANFPSPRATVRLKRQRCHAVSVKFQDGPPGGVLPAENSGRGVRLEGLSLEVQIDAGLDRGHMKRSQRG